MSKQVLNQNLRGSAIRSDKKEIRIATHVQVLKDIIEKLVPDVVIEHGMGKSSTPLLHQLGVRNIVSIEDDNAWKFCKTCDATHDSNNIHRIISYHEIDDILQKIDPTKTIVFLDGPDSQRQDLLQKAMKLKISAIIEHDVETLSNERVETTRKTGTENCYSMHQYIKENPETGLYVHECISFTVSDDYVKF